jgi:hypothetical protein
VGQYGSSGWPICLHAWVIAHGPVLRRPFFRPGSVASAIFWDGKHVLDIGDGACSKVLLLLVNYQITLVTTDQMREKGRNCFG